MTCVGFKKDFNVSIALFRYSLQFLIELNNIFQVKDLKISTLVSN